MTSEQIAARLLAVGRVTSCIGMYKDLVSAAVRYARLRTDWALLDREGRIARDPARSRAHEVLLDACNILSRAMLRAGEDNSWRAELGDERGFIGDVACHMHGLLGLAAR